jgi:hypothetical protein
MAKREKGPRAGGADVRRETYKGHEILYPRDERRKKIFIDGRPVKWGEAGGTFYLNVYAYDRGQTLEETVKRYIGYLDKTGKGARKEGK